MIWTRAHKTPKTHLCNASFLILFAFWFRKFSFYIFAIKCSCLNTVKWNSRVRALYALSLSERWWSHISLFPSLSIEHHDCCVCVCLRATQLFRSVYTVHVYSAHSESERQRTEERKTKREIRCNGDMLVECLLCDKLRITLSFPIILPFCFYGVFRRFSQALYPFLISSLNWRLNSLHMFQIGQFSTCMCSSSSARIFIIF